MTVPVLVAAVMAAGSACAQPGGITRDEYLDLVEAAVAAYPEDHVAEYIDDADRNSVGGLDSWRPRLALPPDGCGAGIDAKGFRAGRHEASGVRVRRRPAFRSSSSPNL